MKTHSVYRSRSMQLLSLSAMAWACAPTLAQGVSASADAGAVYQRERAACLSIQSAEDRATCLREAAAAQAQRRKGESRCVRRGRGVRAASGQTSAACDRAGLPRDCEALVWRAPGHPLPPGEHGLRALRRSDRVLHAASEHVNRHQGCGADKTSAQPAAARRRHARPMGGPRHSRARSRSSRQLRRRWTQCRVAPGACPSAAAVAGCRTCPRVSSRCVTRAIAGHAAQCLP